MRPTVVRLVTQFQFKFLCGEAEGHPNDWETTGVIGSPDWVGRERFRTTCHAVARHSDAEAIPAERQHAVTLSGCAVRLRCPSGLGNLWRLSGGSRWFGDGWSRDAGPGFDVPAPVERFGTKARLFRAAMSPARPRSRGTDSHGKSSSVKRRNSLHHRAADFRR